ncbi:predicted protein [Histoplasma mississippiense (nom. inval.)]|uniref:predicted protein n=1 Tax=Ajellomyces capsulatus (strain NAm1 / WU24) TaxID=2059318 RepID=UPI000157B723|nr:predicted protein [Histoplasma mississippiense (nom. inval.)]EDN03422.1 predicted protein [Histoplasma mississippiense (nom. inval.)]
MWFKIFPRLLFSKLTYTEVLVKGHVVSGSSRHFLTLEFDNISEMAFEISKLAKEDIPYSVEIVQKAFEDDPYFLWVFDAQKFRATWLNSGY